MSHEDKVLPQQDLNTVINTPSLRRGSSPLILTNPNPLRLREILRPREGVFWRGVTASGSRKVGVKYELHYK